VKKITTHRLVTVNHIHHVDTYMVWSRPEIIHVAPERTDSSYCWISSHKEYNSDVQQKLALCCFPKKWSTNFTILTSQRIFIAGFQLAVYSVGFRGQRVFFNVQICPSSVDFPEAKLWIFDYFAHQKPWNFPKNHGISPWFINFAASRRSWAPHLWFLWTTIGQENSPSTWARPPQKPDLTGNDRNMKL